MTSWIGNGEKVLLARMKLNWPKGWSVVTPFKVVRRRA